jgi:hypothetical protein
MGPASRRRLFGALAILAGLGLPLTGLAVLLMLDPYRILLSKDFEVRNSLAEAVEVTPVGGMVMFSGEKRWHVVPQLASPFLAAPAFRQARLPVAPGQTISLRGNFDDISLGVIIVGTADGRERALVVDEDAARGKCCYPPKPGPIVIAEKDLEPASRGMLAEVARAHAESPSHARGWYLLVGSGLAAAVLFALFLARYRALRKATAP